MQGHDANVPTETAHSFGCNPPNDWCVRSDCINCFTHWILFNTVSPITSAMHRSRKSCTRHPEPAGSVCCSRLSKNESNWSVDMQGRTLCCCPLAGAIHHVSAVSQTRLRDWSANGFRISSACFFFFFVILSWVFHKSRTLLSEGVLVNMYHCPKWPKMAQKLLRW